MKTARQRLAQEFVGHWCHEPGRESDTGDLKAPRTVAVAEATSTQSNIFDRTGRHRPVAFPWRPCYGSRLRRCCGLDVHKKTVVACVITAEGQETHSFGTVDQGLLELADWLAERRLTHIAMESSGMFWKPVYNS